MDHSAEKETSGSEQDLCIQLSLPFSAEPVEESRTGTKNCSGAVFVSPSQESPEQAEPIPDTNTPFFPELDPDGPEPEEEKILIYRDLQRAALAWLVAQNPTAAAVRVPTRLARYKADAAAFWSSPKKHRLLMPERTVLVEVRLTRDACWPDCSNSDEILPAMREIQEKRSLLEARIRELEPELRDNDMLFPEIESWDYGNTKMEEYHSCIRQLKEYETALYRGSRFERIRESGAASELYLAVPEGLVLESELAENWGLLYIGNDLRITMVHRAVSMECKRENMIHFAQNIASSAMKDVLFANGLSREEDGSILFRRIPKKRSADPSVQS